MNQTERILEHMVRGNRIDRYGATFMGVGRLASRIHEIKGKGYPVQGRYKFVAGRFGDVRVKEYWL